ncbi:MAG: sulfatase-like hydrolase/transferase [Hyphomicrobiaceae bacterium]
MATLAVLAIVASVEQSGRGQLAVFLLLSTNYLAIVVSTRRVITCSATLIALLAALRFADQTKYAAFHEHIHFIDLISLLEYVKTGSILLIRQYSGPLLVYGSGIVAGILALLILARIEGRKFPSTPPRGFVRAAVVSLAVANVVVYVTGNWFYSASNHYVLGRMKVAGLTTTSHVLASIGDYIKIKNEGLLPQSGTPAGAALAAPAPIAGGCQNCADVVIVHLESVFDPSLMAAFAGNSMFDHFGDRLTARSGALLVRVLAGYSALSEFSFNCGVDSRIFGIAGQVPNLFLAPLTKRCAARHFKAMGYDTEVVSSIAPALSGYGATYKAYGFDRYYQPGDFGIPKDWWEMRDTYFVGAAEQRLAEPRDKPLLLMLLTAYNHGPHGKWWHSPKEVFTGPYDSRRAGLDEREADYVNRLNDSITAFKRLEQFIADRKRPTLIIYYGDHQPYFVVGFDKAAKDRFGDGVRYVTGFRVARNFDVNRPVDMPDQPMTIERLWPYGLRFAGMRPTPAQARIADVTASCGTDQNECSPTVKAELKRVLATP